MAQNNMAEKYDGVFGGVAASGPLDLQVAGGAARGVQTWDEAAVHTEILVRATDNYLANLLAY
jgi:hypothetical protein